MKTIIKATVFSVLLSSPLLLWADFGAYIQSPEGEVWIQVSSFGWQIPPKPGAESNTADFSEVAFRNGRIAPDQGPAMLIITKDVDTEIDGLSGLCGGDSVIPFVHVEMPIWDVRLPTDEPYFQHYVLEQVTLKDCQYTEGAVADALWLEFASIKKEGEQRPFKQ